MTAGLRKAPLSTTAREKPLLMPVREMQIFGERTLLERSSVLGFSPQTLLMVVSNLSWQQLIETGVPREHGAMVAWVNSVEKGSRMQRRTWETLNAAFLSAGNADFGRPITPDELRTLKGARATPWRMLFRQLHRQRGPLARALLTRLAMYDRFATNLVVLNGDVERRQQNLRLVAGCVKYWKHAGFDLPSQASMVLDATLHHLAWLDTHLKATRKVAWEANPVTSLSDPTKEPMRHWFDGLLMQTKCGDLVDLYKYLGAQGVTSKDNVISHDLLKKWASTQELMPHHAVLAVLGGCELKVDRRHEHYRLWVARLLTFLGCFIAAFNSEAVTYQVAREAVHTRLLVLRDGFLRV